MSKNAHSKIYQKQKTKNYMSFVTLATLKTDLRKCRLDGNNHHKKNMKSGETACDKICYWL